MNSSKRLQPIKKLADNKEKEAAQNLGKSLELRKMQLNKLAQLRNYRTEYVNSMSMKTQQGMYGDQLQQYHLFLTKLDTAIGQQQLVVNESEQNLSKSQDNWRSDSSRANAITHAIDKMKIKENSDKNKIESSQNDEMSTQAFLRQKQF
ncbi:MAG: flagellar export protein FliJ [Kangiellaceae bacterium]|nr:flagellar export protein FliJ [Kangiellaceae bacterium]